MYPLVKITEDVLIQNFLYFNEIIWGYGMYVFPYATNCNADKKNKISRKTEIQIQDGSMRFLNFLAFIMHFIFLFSFMGSKQSIFSVIRA